VPWVKKKRRRKWYRKTNLKIYFVIVLFCVLVAAVLSILVEKAPVVIDGLEENIIREMARQSESVGGPNTPQEIRKPIQGVIDPADRRTLEKLQKTYAETGKLDARDRESIEALKRKYADEMDLEDLERLRHMAEEYRNAESGE